MCVSICMDIMFAMLYHMCAIIAHCLHMCLMFRDIIVVCLVQPIHLRRFCDAVPLCTETNQHAHIWLILGKFAAKTTSLAKVPLRL